MWDLPYFNLGNNLYMHTIGGASIKQETTATPETLAVLISKGALSQSPCTRHHLATIVRVPVHLIQTCSAVSFPVYPMPCCPKGELCPYQEEITGLPCSLLLWKMHTAGQDWACLKMLAEQSELENTSAEEFWKDNETLLPNTKKLLIKW